MVGGAASHTDPTPVTHSPDARATTLRMAPLPLSTSRLPVEMVTSVVAKDREGHEVVAFAFKPSKK